MNTIKTLLILFSLTLLTGCGFASAWPTTDTLPEDALTYQDQFDNYITKWVESGQEITADAFTKVEEGRMMPGEKYDSEIGQDDFLEPKPHRRSYSTNGTKFIDYLHDFDLDTQTLIIYNRDDSWKWEELVSCGVECQYDHGWWIDDKRFVVAGVQKIFDGEEEKTHINEECEEEKEMVKIQKCDDNGYCAYSLIVELYNTEASKWARYQTGEIWTAENPHDEQRELRYLKSLTEIEKLRRDARIKHEEELKAKGIDPSIPVTCRDEEA